MKLTNLNSDKLSSFLKRYRKNIGLRIEDIEDKELSISTISRIENDVEGVGEKKVRIYCEKLGVELEDIPDLMMEDDEKIELVKVKIFSMESFVEFINPDQALQKIEEIPINEDAPPLILAKIWYLKGRCHVRKHNLKRAETAFNKVIHYVQKEPLLKKENLEAIAYHELQRISYIKDDLKNSLDLNAKSIKVLDNIENEKEKNKLAYRFSITRVIVLDAMGKIPEALEELNKLWKHIKEIKNSEILLNMFDLKANLSKKLSLYEEAIETATEGIVLATDGKSPHRATELWLTLGSIYNSKGEIEKAENCFLTALEMKDDINKIESHEVTKTIYIELGKLYISLEKWAEAEDILKIAEKQKDKLTPARYAEVLTVLGECYIMQKRYKTAIRVLEKAIVTTEENDLKAQLKQLLLKLSYCWEKEGDQQKHMEFLQKFFIIEMEH